MAQTGEVAAPILITDDRASDRTALESALAPLGQPIVQASSGQEALEVLLRKDFAAILLDVRMPEMDGFETARYIRKGKRSRHTPILFVTAGDEDVAVALEGYSAGAVDFIRKPVHPEILRSKVQIFVDLYRKSWELSESAIELRRANDGLQGACRDLEVFTYTVAHELRSPLRAMSGLARMLREDYAGKPFDGTGQDYALRMEQAANRMDALIRDLLTYCSVVRDPAAAGTVDAGEVVREVLGSLGPALRDRHAEVRADEAFPRVLANGALLGLALTNFVWNSITYVAPGVVPEVRIGHASRPGWECLWVEDNGVGIHPEFHERIFGVFERLQPSSEDSRTGMGLAVAKAAAERMGGRVGVRSEPNRGSRFWIEVPSALQSGAREPAPKAVGESLP